MLNVHINPLRERPPSMPSNIYHTASIDVFNSFSSNYVMPTNIPRQCPSRLSSTPRICEVLAERGPSRKSSNPVGDPASIIEKRKKRKTAVPRGR